MKFPHLLTKAVIKGSKLHFRYGDLEQSDEELSEYGQWKTWNRIGPICRPSDLVKLYRKGAYVDEIRRLLVRNGKLSLLATKPARALKRVA